MATGSSGVGLRCSRNEATGLARTSLPFRSPPSICSDKRSCALFTTEKDRYHATIAAKHFEFAKDAEERDILAFQASTSKPRPHVAAAQIFRGPGRALLALRPNHAGSSFLIIESFANFRVDPHGMNIEPCCEELARLSRADCQKAAIDDRAVNR